MGDMSGGNSSASSFWGSRHTSWSPAHQSSPHAGVGAGAATPGNNADPKMAEKLMTELQVSQYKVRSTFEWRKYMWCCFYIQSWIQSKAKQSRPDLSTDWKCFQIFIELLKYGLYWVVTAGLAVLQLSNSISTTSILQNLRLYCSQVGRVCCIQT